jgi:hypothetical protein
MVVTSFVRKIYWHRVVLSVLEGGRVHGYKVFMWFRVQKEHNLKRNSLYAALLRRPAVLQTFTVKFRGTK